MLCVTLIEDTMSDITSLWRSDEKEYQRNGFSRNDLVFSANQFKVGDICSADLNPPLLDDRSIVLYNNVGIID